RSREVPTWPTTAGASASCPSGLTSGTGRPGEAEGRAPRFQLPATRAQGTSNRVLTPPIIDSPVFSHHAGCFELDRTSLGLYVKNFALRSLAERLLKEPCRWPNPLSLMPTAVSAPTAAVSCRKP